MAVHSSVGDQGHARTLREVVCWAVAAASAAAAAIHFSVIGEQYRLAWSFGVFFAVVAWAQVAWAVGVVARPGRRMLLAGFALQSLVVGVYLLSRTTGLPVGPMPWHPYAVAFEDLVCTLFEVAAAGGALLLVLRRLDQPLGARPMVASLSALLLVIGAATGGALVVADGASGGMGNMSMADTSSATMSPMGSGSGSSGRMDAMGPGGSMGASTTGSMGTMSGAGGSTSSSMGSMAMDSGSSATTMAGMGGADGATVTTVMGDMDMGGSTSTTMPGMPGMPSTGDGSFSLATTSAAGSIIWPEMPMTMEPGMAMAGPACTATPNAAQQAAAVALVDQTVTTTSKYRSLAVAKAAGYVPITPTGATVVHYLNFADLGATTLSTVLNPEAPQSLVYANTSTGPRLVAAMYVMPTGSSATPPSPGGCLTQWHIHTNLCFNSSNQVVGLTDPSGACPPGSANRVTQPMLHVWLAPVPGGPLMVDEPDATVGTAAAVLPAGDPPPEQA